MRVFRPDSSNALSPQVFTHCSLSWAGHGDAVCRPPLGEEPARTEQPPVNLPSQHCHGQR